MYSYLLYIAKRNRTLVSSAKPPKGITGAEATVSKHCMWDPFVSFRDTLKPIFDDTKKQRRPIHVSVAHFLSLQGDADDRSVPLPEARSCCIRLAGELGSPLHMLRLAGCQHIPGN